MNIFKIRYKEDGSNTCPDKYIFVNPKYVVSIEPFFDGETPIYPGGGITAPFCYRFNMSDGSKIERVLDFNYHEIDTQNPHAGALNSSDIFDVRNKMCKP